MDRNPQTNAHTNARTHEERGEGDVNFGRRKTTRKKRTREERFARVA